MVASSAAGGGVVLPPGVRPLEIADPAEMGGHQLVGRLGSGGMGVVYLGTDRRGGLAAVKAAHYASTNDELRRRFRAEAACVRRAPAAYTARLLADGTDQTPPYIITEYIEGRSLEDIVENDGPLPPEQLRALATGVARALAAIHDAGLIHRDLKPANVLLTPTGPRVIDFGIAQEIPASGGATAVGMVMGSPGWISPERLTMSPATPAADIFCWGCLITFAGTGRHPFGHGDSEEVVRRTIHEAPDLDGLDASFERLVEAALAKDPADRPSALELLASPGPEEPVVADREPRHARHAQPASATRSRRARRVTAFTTGTAGLVAATTLTAMLATDSDRPVGRKPGIAAAPPTRAAGPHRSAVPEVRGTAPEDTSSGQPGPYSSPAPHRPGAGLKGATDPYWKKATGGGVAQDPTGTAGRTVARATSGPPTKVIDDLLKP